MLTDRELAVLRTDLEALLTDNVVVQRATRTSDGAGGQAVSWSTVAAVSGMIAPAILKPSEASLLADRVTVSQLWTLSVPWDTDIRTGDRAVIGGRTFEVLVVKSGTFVFLKRVTAIEVL